MRISIYPISLLFATACMGAAIFHLNQVVQSYYDFVALMVVSGGTIAVALTIIPWQFKHEVRQGFKMLIKGLDKNYNHKVLRNCIEFLSLGHQKANELKLDKNSLYGQILTEGSELISLGIKTERIEAILRERVFQESKRRMQVANSLRSLAKYPPAFGLVGTVLGLVNVMRGIAEEISSKETGLLMAIALVATLYGLLISNLIVNPAGELILKWATQEEDMGILAVQTVLLASDKISILESQELLNSYVNSKARINILNNFIERTEDAA